MKTSLMLILLIACTATKNYAQNTQLAIDTAAFTKWRYVSEANITEDGSFAGFVLQQGWEHDYGNPKTLIIKSTNGDWSETFGPNVIRYEFSSDSKKVFLLYNFDSLNIVELGTGRLIKNFKSNSFQVIRFKRIECTLLESADQTLRILNDRAITMPTILDSVNSYHIDKIKNRIYIVKASGDIFFVDVNTMKKHLLGHFEQFEDFTLSANGEYIAFRKNFSVWIVNTKTGSVEKTKDLKSALPDGNLFISEIVKFNKSGDKIFINITEKEIQPIEKSSAKIRVWNYRDAMLRTDPSATRSIRSYLAYYDLNTEAIIRVEKEFENARFLNEDNTDFIAIDSVRGADYEKHWNKIAQPKHYIYDCRSGLRYQVKFQPRDISPDGSIVVGLDSLSVNYLAWNVTTQTEYDITKPLGVIPDQRGVVMEELQYWTLAGWINKHDLLLYDRTDIWQINGLIPSKAINITNGFGRSQHIVFTIPNSVNKRLFDKKQLSVIHAFNKENKQSGFYSLPLQGKGDPVKLSMNNALISKYYLRGKNSMLSIILKQRADSSPNFFLTDNFKTFRPLSNIYPEKNYKWLTSELYYFNTLDGKKSQAVIYKPDDFNPATRYPVIINYYEKFSDELHMYQAPEASSDNLNIPWFVSRGYIVVRPDIQYTPKKPGESALNSVEGVARQLSLESYIDGKHIGIIGHSWGGFETNYIITHTGYFSAAISSAGVSNLISSTTSLTRRGVNMMDMMTHTRNYRLGQTIWERPDLYLDNSPILKVGKISTPLLIFANEKDAAVNVEEGIQLFWSMRRLNKPCWLVQYEGEPHNLLQYDNKLDYSFKVQGFFDHFLKGLPKPDWMSEVLN